MLYDVFSKVLHLSLLGTYSFIIVFLVRFLLLKCDRKYAYYLWLVVFINFCVVLPFHSRYSIVPQELVTYEAEELSEVPIQEQFYPDGTDNPWMEATGNTQTILIPTEIQNITKDTSSQSLVSGISFGDVCAAIWIGILAFLIVWNVCRLVGFRRKFRVVGKVATEDEPRIIETDQIPSPFILGIFQPTIFLPSHIDGEEKEYILKHELCHYKRRDYLLKPLVFGVVLLHWFNPIVWLTYSFFCKDMEISCDESVLKSSDFTIQKQYAQSLLKYAARQNGYLFTPITFGEPSVKSRIQNVLNFRKKSVVYTLIGVGCVAIIGIGLLMKPARENTGDHMSEQGNAHMDTTEQMTISPASVSYTFDDRQLIMDCKVESEAELLIFDKYYYTVSGDFGKLREITGSNEALQISLDNEEEAFREGIYTARYIIHQVEVLSKDSLESIKASTWQDLVDSVQQYGLTEYEVVWVDLTWKYNDKKYSLAPQLDNGRYDRYYLVGKTAEDASYKIYEVYWDDFLDNTSDDYTGIKYLTDTLTRSYFAGDAFVIKDITKSESYDGITTYPTDWGDYKILATRGLPGKSQTYENGSSVTVRVEFSADGVGAKYDLIMELYKQDNTWKILKYSLSTDWERVNLIEADLTHDGIPDYIEMTKETSDDWTIYISVYDGKNVNDRQTLSNPIWDHVLSKAVVGNGQLSLVQRDDDAYLVLTNIGTAVQGGYYFVNYRVISFDSLGNTLTKEQYDDSFYLSDAAGNPTNYLYGEYIEQLDTYKNLLLPWLEDGQLLVSMDADASEQLVSSPQSVYPPEAYYELVWETWDSQVLPEYKSPLSSNNSTPLDEEQIRRANEYFVLSDNPVSQELRSFFAGYYASPENIALDKFLHNCEPIDGTLGEENVEEFETVKELLGLNKEMVFSEMSTAIRRYKKGTVDAMLQKYANISADDLNHVEGLPYSDEYNAFYIAAGDVLSQGYEAVGGEADGEYIRFWSMPRHDDSRDILTLCKVGNKYYIYSFINTKLFE